MANKHKFYSGDKVKVLCPDGSWMDGEIISELENLMGGHFFWVIQVPGYNERFHTGDPEYAEFEVDGTPNAYYDLVIESESDNVKFRD